MINELDRKTLVRYRMDQARDTVDLAKFLIDSGKLVVAVNRIYYGMYYAITALAIQHHFQTSKHIQLIGWFNRNWVSQGIIEARFGKILRNAFQNRTKGDYDAFVYFESEEVWIMYGEMTEFISAIEQLLDERSD
jgi:uncharacterized protein (UPF0332 family)